MYEQGKVSVGVNLVKILALILDIWMPKNKNHVALKKIVTDISFNQLTLLGAMVYPVQNSTINTMAADALAPHYNRSFHGEKYVRQVGCLLRHV